MQRSTERRRRWLIGLEACTGVAGVIGGVLLAVRPDGSLLDAQLSALRGSPFRDWRLPGVLLATLVGAGLLCTALVELRRWRRAHALSVAVAGGLIVFEALELAWIGPQPLEAVFAGIGGAIAALARRPTVRSEAEFLPSPRPGGPPPDSDGPGVDLLWIPLGAGGHVVRLNGKIFEAITALIRRRPRQDLYHAALEVTGPDGAYVIELAPVLDRDGAARGVVGTGAVGSRWLGRFQVFRYELRRWRGGVIPDRGYATGGPQRVSAQVSTAQRVLDLMPSVPLLVWGRDELDAGEMWNSNSVISWLLVRAGVDTTSMRPPTGGRAPGWDAGIVAGSRSG